MPMYEYRCKACGEVFDKMVRWSEADLRPACPKCQSQETQKKISQVASFGSSASISSASGSSCATGGRFS